MWTLQPRFRPVPIFRIPRRSGFALFRKKNSAIRRKAGKLVRTCCRWSSLLHQDQLGRNASRSYCSKPRGRGHPWHGEAGKCGPHLVNHCYLCHHSTPEHCYALNIKANHAPLQSDVRWPLPFNCWSRIISQVQSRRFLNKAAIQICSATLLFGDMRKRLLQCYSGNRARTTSASN